MPSRTIVEPAPAWRITRDTALPLDRPRLIGILNVTPDSFSDGGRFLDPDAAVHRAVELIREGANIIDVGGESTRPGAARVDAQEQIRRVVPVIRALRGRLAHAPAPVHGGASGPETFAAFISIDTTLASVARAAIDAGADIINDVSAGREDSWMFPLAAERGCGLLLMHRLVPPGRDSYSDRYADHARPRYGDVVAEVCRFLVERAEAAAAAGVERDRIAVDPGLGFGKTVEQNYELIARCDELASTGYPVVTGASRKSFIGHAGGVESPVDRVCGSVAAAAVQYLGGVRLFRVHDVAAHRQGLAVAAAVVGARAGSSAESR
jgi:dihydropteroate synthase